MNLARTFTRISASKYGCSYFGKLEEQGIYGRVGYGDLMAVKACQDESVTSLTSEIEECFEVIEAVMRFEPKREFTVLLLPIAKNYNSCGSLQRPTLRSWSSPW